MNHMMIDIETCGKRANAPILSIGAVMFDPMTGGLGQTFYAAVDPADAFRNGVPDGDTFAWWMQQGDKARAAAVGGKKMLAAALGELIDFGKGRWSNVTVWGNGPSFDMTILEHGFSRVGREIPWMFWNVRDCRTVADLAGKRPPKIGGNGVYHNALDDAKHQALWVSEMWQGLKGKQVSRAEPAPAADDLLL